MMPDYDGVIAQLFGLDDIDDEQVVTWYPEEWMILITGLRGGCKSLELARLSWWALMEPTIPVYSNMDYKEEGLQEYGIKARPIPLDWDALISFKLGAVGALIVIDEVTTYLNKLRTNTNQNMLADGVWQQLRKMSMKIAVGCQFGNYLPYGTMDQVDLIMYCQDAFYSEWGRENGLEKGTMPIITVTDKSGYFTGGRSQPWTFTYPGKEIWPLYYTEKIHDVKQVAQKYEIKSTPKVVGADDEIYPEGEESAMSHERELRQYQKTITKLWDIPFMGFIHDNAEKLALNDLGDKIRISCDRIEKAIAQVKGDSKRDLKAGYQYLLTRAREGVVATKRYNVIEILKPSVFAEGDEVLDFDKLAEYGIKDLGYEKVQ